MAVWLPAFSADCGPACPGRFGAACTYRSYDRQIRRADGWEVGVDAEVTFLNLVGKYMSGKLRGPFNWPARIEAGFEESELSVLEQGV